MKSQLAIFDLDGTLYDTVDVNYEAYRLALKVYGRTLDHDHYHSKCNGQFYRQFLPTIFPDLSEHDVEQIHEKKKELYQGCLSKAGQNTHLINIIRHMRSEYYIALVTTASKRNAEEILDYFNHRNLFDLIVTQEDVRAKKPDPEGFCSAMRFFGVTPARTLIFEDSDDGVQAAIRSGASVFRALAFRRGLA